MGDFRYPYVKQPDWNEYRSNNSGVFTVAKPGSEIYQYYTEYPFENYNPEDIDYQNQNPYNYTEEENYNNGIYYKGYTPQQYNDYIDFDPNNPPPYFQNELVEPPFISRNKLHPSLLHPQPLDEPRTTITPPLINPVVLVNRKYLENNRNRPPSYEDDKPQVTELKIKRDRVPTPLEKHDFDDKPIKEFKIKRDIKDKKVDFNKEPVNFDDLPIRPLLHNPYTDDNSKFLTPPQTVDTTISKLTPRTRQKGAVYNFRNKNLDEVKPSPRLVAKKKVEPLKKKPTSFEIPLNEDEPVKPIQKRFLTMKLGQEKINNVNSKPMVGAVDRKPIRINSVLSVESKFNRPPSSVRSQPQAQTMINTKYVIIHQNGSDSNKPTPRSISRTSSLGNPVLMTQNRSPQPFYQPEKQQKDVYNITRFIDQSPRPSILTPSQQKQPKTVNYEIIKRKNPVRTIVHHYFK
jgi:hypothetical protein